MKVARIIQIFNTYNKIQERIKEDEYQLKNYSLIKHDDQKARIYKIRLDIDNEVLGNFLDEEI